MDTSTGLPAAAATEQPQACPRRLPVSSRPAHGSPSRRWPSVSASTALRRLAQRSRSFTVRGRVIAASAADRGRRPASIFRRRRRVSPIGTPFQPWRPARVIAAARASTPGRATRCARACFILVLGIRRAAFARKDRLMLMPCRHGDALRRRAARGELSRTPLRREPIAHYMAAVPRYGWRLQRASLSGAAHSKP